MQSWSIIDPVFIKQNFPIFVFEPITDLGITTVPSPKLEKEQILAAGWINEGKFKFE